MTPARTFLETLFAHELPGIVTVKIEPRLTWLSTLISPPNFATASGGLPTGLPHTDPAFYLQKAATWANAYIAVFPSRTFGATFFFFAVVVFGQPPGFLSISFVDALIGSTTLYCLIRIKALERQHRESGVIR